MKSGKDIFWAYAGIGLMFFLISIGVGGLMFLANL